MIRIYYLILKYLNLFKELKMMFYLNLIFCLIFILINIVYNYCLCTIINIIINIISFKSIYIKSSNEIYNSDLFLSIKIFL